MAEQSLHIVLAALKRKDGAILIGRRDSGSHQGGLWELPGGKVEADESSMTALVREVREETGFWVRRTTPLLRLLHDYPAEGRYPARTVHLEVWLVNEFHGDSDLPGGEWRWVMPGDLSGYAFPAANRPIIRALQLTRLYQITPVIGEHFDNGAVLLAYLEWSCAQGSRLISFRQPHLNGDDYCLLAEKVILLAHGYGARVLLNCPVEWSRRIQADGLHLNSERLLRCQSRPVGESQLFAASCHNEGELQWAEQVGADFVVLSPVKPSASHPGAPALGWERFRALCSKTSLPVYALGGMGSGDLLPALFAGAQGIAAIRSLYPGTQARRVIGYCTA